MTRKQKDMVKMAKYDSNKERDEGMED